MDTEISAICAPMGRPLANSVRTMARRGTNSRQSVRAIHSGWWRQRSQPSSAASANALATPVDRPDPAIPICGKGPMPKMSSGLSTTSSATASSRNKNGVRASPAPRSTAETKVNRYRNGIDRNSMRR